MGLCPSCRAAAAELRAPLHDHGHTVRRVSLILIRIIAWGGRTRAFTHTHTQTHHCTVQGTTHDATQHNSTQADAHTHRHTADLHGCKPQGNTDAPPCAYPRSYPSTPAPRHMQLPNYPSLSPPIPQRSARGKLPKERRSTITVPLSLSLYISPCSAFRSLRSRPQISGCYMSVFFPAKTYNRL